jgi:hypothetical protein
MFMINASVVVVVLMMRTVKVITVHWPTCGDLAVLEAVSLSAIAVRFTIPVSEMITRHHHRPVYPHHLLPSTCHRAVSSPYPSRWSDRRPGPCSG